MTTLATTAPIAGPSTLRRSWRVPIGLAIGTLLGLLLFVIFGHHGSTTISLTASSNDAFDLPSPSLPAFGTGVVTVLLAAAATVWSGWLTAQDQRTPLWLSGLFGLDLVIGFLVWAMSGHTLPLPGLLAGALALSVPLIFGALGGVISERAGVVNVAIEGQLLAGAFVAAVIGSLTHSLVIGLLAAMVAGMLVSFLLAAFAITYLVDQVIVGVVLNVLVLGLTSFLYTSVLVNNAQKLNTPPQFHNVKVPGLSSIPVIGPVLFDQTPIVYVMYVAVAVISYGLFQTRWGLRLRAVGEHPQAADTVGINVGRTRFWNVALAGAIAGLGGSYFTLAAVPSFTKNVTSGVGFIALAAVIFGRWNPLRATLAALLFGFATNLQFVLGIAGSTVPSDVLLMLPYLVTIFAVAGMVGRVRGPAASGKPYIKG